MEPLGEWLEQDHHRLDDLWDRAAAAWATARPDAQDLYRQFEEGLLRHIAAEEDLAFPFFENRGPVGSKPLTDLLRREHSEIRTAVANLREKVEVGKGDLADAAIALRNVLWEHNAREEARLYPWFGLVTTEGEGQDLARQVRNRVCAAGHPE